MAIADLTLNQPKAKRSALSPRRLPARRWPTGREWLLFAVQVLLVAMVEVGDDILRGNIWRPDAMEALANARKVASFEWSHDLFVEPGLQSYFQHPHRLFGFLLTWPEVVRFADGVYAFCHIFVTLGVVVWLFVDHRPRFALVRNVTFLTNLVALLGYELYPMAPPRLTSDLVVGHHLIRFQDTMGHVLGNGTLNGTPIGYNPFSAMPSLHVAWALIVGAVLVMTARHPLIRLLGVLYPALMIFTVVITANHYLMDAAGAALAAGLATAIVLGVRWMVGRLPVRQLCPVRVEAGTPRVSAWVPYSRCRPIRR
ncbi:MAG: phosphatase PAP2 family protein [Chloroflexi bacterium]|nr:phosphatase PAP2 family protein [Chloroflexota bacterium]